MKQQLYEQRIKNAGACLKQADEAFKRGDDKMGLDLLRRGIALLTEEKD
jgi:hypothetical protein